MKRWYGRWSVLVVVVLSVMLAAKSADELPLSFFANGVFGEKDCYVLLPPEPIAGASIGEVMPSPDGTSVLVRRVIAPPIRSLLPAPPLRLDSNLILWNAKTRRTAMVWHGSMSETRIEAVETVEWLPKTRFALAMVSVYDMTSSGDAEESKTMTEVAGRLLLVDASAMTARTLTTTVPEERLIVGSNSASAVLYSQKNRTVRTIAASGVIGRPMTIATEHKLPYFLYWYEEGKTLLSIYEVKDGKGKSASSLIDVTTGNVTDKAEFVPPPRPVEESLDTAAGACCRRPGRSEAGRHDGTLTSLCGLKGRKPPCRAVR